MKKLPVLSFFDYMQQYPHIIPGRTALATELKRLAVFHDEIEEINSLIDLMTVAHKFIKDGKALAAITGSLWCEYCAVSGRPFFEESFDNEQQKKRGRKKHLE